MAIHNSVSIGRLKEIDTFKRSLYILCRIVNIIHTDITFKLKYNDENNENNASREGWQTAGYMHQFGRLLKITLHVLNAVKNIILEK